MKALLKTGVCFLIFAGIFSAGPAQAFNSGTHLFIAERVFPFSFDKIDLYYGSMAPDISLYAPPGTWLEGFEDTHLEVINLPYAWWNPVQASFSKGWKTHNEAWGADYYAHVCYFPTPIPGGCTGYVIAKAEALIQDVPLLKTLPNQLMAGELAHFAVEAAVDLLVLENDDHVLGQKLFGAALLRSSEDVKVLAKALRDRVDPAVLYSAESTFRDLLIDYGAALSLPSALRMPAMGVLGAQVAASYGATIPPAAAAEILEKAVDLCERDYRAAIQAAISGISKRVR